MSFPNPDNYARDCDCGTAGANTTPPPASLVAAVQSEIDSLDTRVTTLEGEVVPDYRLLRASPATSGDNIGAGLGALVNNTTGIYNSAFGYLSLNQNTIGLGNTASGFQALRVNISGSANTALGSNALGGTTSGSNNTVVGYQALLLNITGGANTAVGVQSLQSNTGSNNTAVGCASLFVNTIGADNVAVGYQAGDAITTGSNNICIGSGSDVSAGTRANCIAIGSGAIATVDGQIAFASTLATKTTLTGANGAATALTANPVGYIRIRIGTTSYQIPYYNE